MTSSMNMTMRNGIVVLLCAALGAPACATSRTTGVTAAPTAQSRVADRSVLADYIQGLPLGSAIRLDFTNGKGLRGTLMKVTDQSVIVQPRTRVPEPAVEVPMADIMRVTLDRPNGSNLGKAIGIGAAAGAGAALAVILILIAAFGD